MIPSPRFVLLISGSTVSRVQCFSSRFFWNQTISRGFQETVQTVQTFLQCRASRMNWSIATINDENISSNVHCTTVIVIVNLLLGINFMYFVKAGLLISFNFVSTVSTCYSLKLFFPNSRSILQQVIWGDLPLYFNCRDEMGRDEWEPDHKVGAGEHYTW